MRISDWSSDVCSSDLEGLPEVAQHAAPVDASAGDVVETLLHLGGEVVLHVALEEAGEEGDDQAAAVFRHEATPIEAHVVAVLQHLQDGGVGGRPPDAELYHLLHPYGLAVARRRLGEVLIRPDGSAGAAI